MGRPFSAVVTLGEDWKQKFDFENDAAKEGETPEWVNLEPLGLCPACKKGEVFETATHYQCDRTHLKECTFRMGKAILQRTIPREQAIKLVLTGKTDLLPRFISKKGRAFAAYLVLEEKGEGRLRVRETRPGESQRQTARAGESEDVTYEARRSGDLTVRPETA